jgi:hypothetical protein
MPTVAKDQQVPHEPWALGGVTAPVVRQSREEGVVSPTLI